MIDDLSSNKAVNMIGDSILPGSPRSPGSPLTPGSPCCPVQ